MSMFFAIFMLIGFALFLIHLLICVWAYRDCVRSGRSGEYALLVVLLVFFFPIAGTIVYLLIRNL